MCAAKNLFQAKTAPTRAAKSPAEPNLTALLRAPPVLPVEVEEGEVEVPVDVRTEEGLVVEDGGLVVVVPVVEVVVRMRDDRELPEVKELLLLLPGSVEREEPAGVVTELEEFEQSVVPDCTVKGADCEVAPVWSRSNSPRDWPAETVTTQVNEVPVRPLQEKRAAEEGLFPGTTLKKKGPALP